MRRIRLIVDRTRTQSRYARVQNAYHLRYPSSLTSLSPYSRATHIHTRKTHIQTDTHTHNTHIRVYEDT